MDEKEIWRPVVGFEGLYEVSDQGRVRSLNYLRTGRTQVLKPGMDGNGYLYVHLCKDGKRKNCKVHRLVAQAFLPNPKGLPEVNHKDECKQNNAVGNIEWCDRKYNLQYGTGIARRAAAQSKPVQQLTKDGLLLATWPSATEAERATGVNQGSIWSCCNGGFYSPKRGKWVNVTQAKGFIWRYIE